MAPGAELAAAGFLPWWGMMVLVARSSDPWAGCPPGWRRVLVGCEGVPGAGHRRKFVGRGWMHRFADGFPAVAFDPAARHVEVTGITHADGGRTFRFSCPFWACGRRPEVREEKLGEWIEGLAGLGVVDARGRVLLDVGRLP